MIYNVAPVGAEARRDALFEPYRGHVEMDGGQDTASPSRASIAALQRVADAERPPADVAMPIRGTDRRRLASAPLTLDSDGRHDQRRFPRSTPHPAATAARGRVGRVGRQRWGGGAGLAPILASGFGGS